MTLSASRNAISSPAEASGPLQLDWLDGLTTAPSGPPPAPASRSRSQVKVPVPTMHGICGPTSFGSPVPDGPLSSWESRLRERLAMVGSTECALIWREKVTPAGRLISRLAPWTPPISDLGNTGSHWPTPKSSNAGPDFAKIQRSATGLSLHTVMAGVSYWPTPTVADVQGGRKTRSGTRSAEALLNGLMTWSTPRASDGAKGGPNQSFGAGGQPLPAQMHQAAAWVTPSARDWKDSAGMATTRPDGRSRIDQLPHQMVATAPSGQITNGSSATTVKRGAPNPAFPCWLMGFPAEWVSGAWRAMQSRPSSRRKSSVR